MSYTAAQRKAIFQNLEKYKQDINILVDIAGYIFDGDPREKNSIMGPKGIQKFTPGKISEIKFNYLDAWFSGLNEGEIDYYRLDKKQQERFDEIRTIFQDAYFAKQRSTPSEAPQEVHTSSRASSEHLSAAAAVQRAVPPPLPPRPAHILEKRRSKRDSAKLEAAEVDPDIVQKNALIIDLIEARLTEVKNDKIKGQTHTDRKFALTEILAHVRTHYGDNKQVIDLEQVEEALKRQHQTHAEKHKRFESGTSKKPSTSYTKSESEYARMKKEAMKIKDNPLSSELTTRKKKHGK